MSAHTSGPWSIWNFSDDPRHVAVGPDAGGLAVADVVACNAHGCYTVETESRGQANARLIAAAPELLTCLLDVLDANGDVNVMDFNRYRATVAKATGNAA